MNLNPGVSASLLAGSEISPRVWLQVPGIPELVSDHCGVGQGVVSKTVVYRTGPGCPEAYVGLLVAWDRS